MNTTTKLLAAALSVTFAGSAIAAPISVTGWESDVIAEAGATSTATSTNGGYVSGSRFVIAAAGYTGNGTPTGTPLAIGPGNIVTTQNGTDFFVDPTVNNTIREEGDGGGTLTLVTAGKYEDLQFLVTGVGGGATGNFKATVNFDDASSTELTASIGDWNSGPGGPVNAFAGRTSHVLDGSAYFGSGLWIREAGFTLSLADQAKNITSIDFAFLNRLGVSGVSGTLVPEPSSLALLGLGGLMIARRRRG